MSFFSLPRNWVYVCYEDGKQENVANQDTLSVNEAKRFAEEWSKARGKKVEYVALVSETHKLLKTFGF